MKIGLFGGTFNPVHLGHVDMIHQTIKRIALDKVFFIPAYIPPHKQNQTLASFEHRVNMLKLAIYSEKNCEVSDYEKQNEGPSYTILTVEFFEKTFPNDEIFYIMGSDSFEHIESWYHWWELLKMCHFIIIDRQEGSFSINENVQRILNESIYQCIHLPLKTMPISSTMIRNQIKKQLLLPDMLSDKVYNYILQNKLYMGD